MEYQKLINLLDTKPDIIPKFNTKNRWMFMQFGGTYNTSKQIRFKTSMLWSDLYDSYIVIPSYSRFHILSKELLIL